MQYINGYICRCLALFFILTFIRLPEYHILQFHTFFFCINPSFGVGGTAINIMDNLELNIADFISTVPKGCIFDAHSVISYLLKNHSDDYFDFHNDAEPTNSFHSRVSRAINPFVDKNIIERIDAKSYSLNIRGNFSENSCWKKI